MADIDNDGDLDLIITGADAQLTNRKTTLYSNDGLGNFTEIIGTGLSNWSEGGKIAFADVDGDTDQDLLITGRDGSANYYVHFYLNDGSGNFTPDTTQPFEPSIGGNLEFADIDNDGDLDLFMTGRDNNNLIFSKLYQNDGTGGFSEMTSTPFLSEGGSASAFFDMDNDNDLDLILAGKNNSNQKKTTLYENDGAGNFSLVSNTPFENVDFAAIAIDDSDNDSDLDVLINGENDSGVPICQLYLNDGTGAFNLLVGTPFIQTALGTVDFADFDNDNDMDVLVTGSVGGQTFAAHIYENQGMNNFSLVDTLETLYLSSTALGDIDNDNDLDAIIIGIAQLSADIYKPRVYENMLTTLSTENTTENYRENILLYPNPSSGILNIRTNHTFTPSIKIYNLIGELVFSEDNLSPNSQITLNQPPGIYMIVIKTNRSTSTSKLIIK
ncbi:T9SS type A sorting domain-containing protein [Algibacter sp.]|nr:T9SS type A sorting domain-containing protein [Algibacter sp.]